MPTITGTSGNDTLPGTSGDDLILGLDGNDTLSGAGGTDTTDGGDGNDVHLVDSADDVVIERAGEGDDTVITSVSYALGDGTWVETLRTADAASVAPLSLIGNEIAQSIYGNAGDNLLNGGRGNDYLVGLEGNDYLIGGAGADVMLGGTGNDTYTIDLAVGDTVRYEGESFPLSATVLDVGDGDSVLVRIDRGNGNLETKTVSVSTLFGTDRVIELSGEGADVILAYSSYALAFSDPIETLVAADGTGDITLRGNVFPNSIYGNDGDNLLRGGSGGDYLVGSGGNDQLFGEQDQDRLEGGDGNDQLDGGDSSDTLIGGAGNDLLIGGGGGTDIMIGGTGDDSYVVRSQFDQVTELAGEGFDSVEVQTLSYTLSPGTSIESLAAASFITASLSLGGNELNQTITGGGGNDQLRGGGGADTLIGGFGNDTYYVSDGRETIVELANGQGFADTVYTSTDYVLNAGAQVEIISTVWQYGDADIDITGNEFGGGQRLIGNFGSNVLDGKGGADTLIGLGGADTFAFSTALGGGNVDQIVDFESGIDTIALDDAIFSTLSPGNLAPGAFATGTAATEADDRIIYDQNTGNLYYDADGSGAGAAVLFGTVNGAPHLDSTDFAII